MTAAPTSIFVSQTFFQSPKLIDSIFGYEPNTIEVCSRSVPGGNRADRCFTVDTNPLCGQDVVANGKTLEEIANNRFDR